MLQCIVPQAPALNAIVIMTARRAVHQHERELEMSQRVVNSFHLAWRMLKT
jgi:hypothetical protein